MSVPAATIIDSNLPNGSGDVDDDHKERQQEEEQHEKEQNQKRKQKQQKTKHPPSYSTSDRSTKKLRLASTVQEYFAQPKLYIPRPEWFVTSTVMFYFKEIPNVWENDDYIPNPINRQPPELIELRRWILLLVLCDINPILRSVQEEIHSVLNMFYASYSIYYDDRPINTPSNDNNEEQQRQPPIFNGQWKTTKTTNEILTNHPTHVTYLSVLQQRMRGQISLAEANHPHFHQLSINRYNSDSTSSSSTSLLAAVQFFIKRKHHKETILHRAIHEHATAAAIEIIRIEYNTVVSIQRQLGQYYDHMELALESSIAKLKSFLECTLLEMRDSKGYTPLLLASQLGNVRIVQELLSCSANRSTSNSSAMMSIAVAAKYGHTGIIKTFMNHFSISCQQRHPNPTLDQRFVLLQMEEQDVNLNSPLMHAVQGGHIAFARYLLRCVPHTVDRPNHFGMSPLLLAAYLGYDEICQLLIYHGAYLESKNKQDCTPLLLACKHGHVNVVRVLVAAGCNIYASDNRQRTAHQIVQRRIVDRRQMVNENNMNNGVEAAAAAAAAAFGEAPPPPQNRQRRTRNRNNRNRRGIVQEQPHQQAPGNDNADGNPMTISSSTDKMILHLLDPLTRIDVMKLGSRYELNYEILRVSTLIHHSENNVTITIQNRGGMYYHPDEVVALPDTPVTFTNFNIPTLIQWIDFYKATLLLRVRTPNPVPSYFFSPVPRFLHDQGTQALLRMMMLPTSLIQIISSYIPLPPLFSKRRKIIRSMITIQPNAAIIAAFDLMDEVLEEGGFLVACDAAHVPPPEPYKSWYDWKFNTIITKSQSHYLHRMVPVHNDDDDMNRSSLTHSVLPEATDVNHPTVYEIRRRIGYISILCKYEALLTPILLQPPYNVPLEMIESLINVADVVSLCRRCLCGKSTTDIQQQGSASKLVQFDSQAARDILGLTTLVLTWYQVLRLSDGGFGSDLRLADE